MCTTRKRKTRELLASSLPQVVKDAFVKYQKTWVSATPCPDFTISSDNERSIGCKSSSLEHSKSLCVTFKDEDRDGFLCFLSFLHPTRRKEYPSNCYWITRGHQLGFPEGTTLFFVSWAI